MEVITPYGELQRLSLPQITHTFSSSHTYKPPSSGSSFKFPRGQDLPDHFNSRLGLTRSLCISKVLVLWSNIQSTQRKDIQVEWLKGFRIQLYTPKFTTAVTEMQMTCTFSSWQWARAGPALLGQDWCWQGLETNGRAYEVADCSSQPQRFRFTMFCLNQRPGFSIQSYVCLLHGESQPVIKRWSWFPTPLPPWPSVLAIGLPFQNIQEMRWTNFH